jgi:hypothetical protein
VGRFDAVDEFSSLDRSRLSAIAVGACQLAVDLSGLDDEAAVVALHQVQAGQSDPQGSESMRALSGKLDEAAWAAQTAADQRQYDSLFRQSRAASALGFALSGEPDEAIYEAAHAVGSTEDLVARLNT